MKLFKKKKKILNVLLRHVPQNFLKTLENMKINSSISRISVKSFNKLLNILKLTDYCLYNWSCIIYKKVAYHVNKCNLIQYTSSVSTTKYTRILMNSIVNDTMNDIFERSS